MYTESTGTLEEAAGFVNKEVNESNFPSIFKSAEEEAAHNKFVGDTISRNRILAGQNIGRKGYDSQGYPL